MGVGREGWGGGGEVGRLSGGRRKTNKNKYQYFYCGINTVEFRSHKKCWKEW